MADAWIKMRKKLLTDPRVWAVSRQLGISVHAVLGGLFHLWCIADDHGGNLSALDADTMDEMVRIKGFVSALPECWIRVHEGGIELPEYDEHNGSTGKRRAMETKRKADARKVSASGADRKRTREEKRREEKSKTTTTPPSVPTELEPYRDAVDLWLTHKREKGQSYKPTGLKALFKAMIKLGAGLPAAVDHSITNNYAGLYPPGGNNGRSGENGRGFQARADQGDKFAHLEGRA